MQVTLHYNIASSGPDELKKCDSSNLRLCKFRENTRSSSTFFGDLLLINDATMWRQIQQAFRQNVSGDLLFSCIVLVSLERLITRPITVLVSSCNAHETLFHYFELNDIEIYQGQARVKLFRVDASLFTWIGSVKTNNFAKFEYDVKQILYTSSPTSCR